MIRKIFITGGGGFIGGALIDRLLKDKNNHIFNLDKIGKESNLFRIKKFSQNNQYKLFHFDLLEKDKVINAIASTQPDLIIHLAAESHVDRSLVEPRSFIESNIVGTLNLLEAAKIYWEKLPNNKKNKFKFHHVSTDEVYGSLGKTGKFDENTKYSPRSPYSASKASSDHLVSSWFYSFSLPVLITNCSNNYGPFQHHEKLIPSSIQKALNGDQIPLYGDGNNVRDWIYIEDHIDALLLVANKGNIGDQYCIGSNNERKNIDVLLQICRLMDIYSPKNYPHEKLIKYVTDRPGHDRRYAIDSTKIKSELGWKPKHSFKKGLERTVQWYIKNQSLWKK